MTRTESLEQFLARGGKIQRCEPASATKVGLLNKHLCPTAPRHRVPLGWDGLGLKPWEGGLIRGADKWVS